MVVVVVVVVVMDGLACVALLELEHAMCGWCAERVPEEALTNSRTTGQPN